MKFHYCLLCIFLHCMQIKDANIEKQNKRDNKKKLLVHNCNCLQVTHFGGSRNLSRNPLKLHFKIYFRINKKNRHWMNKLSWIAKYLKLSCIAHVASCCPCQSAFCVPVFHVQLQVTFVFLSATFKCSAHVLCLIFFYYLPSLSLPSPPSLTSNYPVYVKGKTFPSSLPFQLTSASFRGLCLNVLSCLSPRSALPVLPVLKCNWPC